MNLTNVSPIRYNEDIKARHPKKEKKVNTAFAVDVTNNSNAGIGTCLQGYVSTTYITLVEKFGEPIQYGEGDKVTVEWIIDFIDNDTYEITTATIYDWKQYEDGTPYDLYDWHIGGRSISAVEMVKQVLGL